MKGKSWQRAAELEEAAGGGLGLAEMAPVAGQVAASELALEFVALRGK